MKHTQFQWVLQGLSAVCVAGMFLWLICVWGTLPDTIPTHYGASGAADAWGSKASLLMLPIISIVTVLPLTLIEFMPKAWNMPISVTEANREDAYRLTRTMLILIKIEILLSFWYITYCQAGARTLGTGFLPIFLGVMAVTLIVPIILMVKLPKE